MNEIADHTRIVSVAEMQRLEKEADAAGQTYATMMEQAGTALAKAVQESFPGSADQSVLVLVGPGNNGGDGLVCARHLSDAGYRVRVYLWARGGYPAKEEQAGKGGKKKAPSRKTGPQEDYEGHLGQVLERNVPAHSADEDADAVQLRAWLDEADIVVDALLGTGANRPIEGALAGILQQLNEVRSRRLPPARTKAGEIGSATASETGGPLALSPLTVVAVDVPSGLNADSGALDPATVAADMTVTFGCAKAGQFLFPGAAVLGELVVADIGIPAELTVDMQTFFLTPEQVADLLPTRGRNSHKGIFGKGMAVVGSVNYPGAAFLSCAAMGRVGAGLVTGAIPQPVWVPLSSALAEPTWILLSHDLGVVNESAAANVGAKLGEYDALLIGCGLGQESATRGFMERLLRRNHKQRPSALPRGFAASESETAEYEQPVSDTDSHSNGEAVADSPSSFPFGPIRRRNQLPAETPPLPPTVIDADGLNLLAQLDDWPSLLPADCVLTPHPAEMARLCGLGSVQEVVDNRWRLARERAAVWQAVVLLKGPYTVIATPEGELAVLPVATAALATAGTGDILAGVITGLLAQGLSPFHAACLGAWLHGRAGELCEQRIGCAGVIATDLLPLLPAAMNELRD